jgi:hypothetical protein
MTEGYGSQVLRKIERDMYLLWEERGMERMPRVLRLHPDLWQAIRMEFTNRITETFHYVGTYDSYRRVETPNVRTLYGDFWFIEDGGLPIGEYVFDHYDAWKRRHEQEAELYARIAWLERRLSGREP